MRKKLSVLLALSTTGTIAASWITYELADIPFGTTFSTALNTALLLLVITILLLGWMLLSSPRGWIAWTSAVPIVLALVVLVSGIAIQNDPRVLHYRGLPPSLTAQEWQEDARFLADNIADKHADLYDLIDSTAWSAAADSLVARIPSLEEPDILMELTRMVGLPGDAHSFPFIMAPCFDLHSFPIILYGFPEGWYIVRTGREMTEFIGSELIAINGMDIGYIYDTFPQLIAWENEQSRKEHFTYMVVMAEWLAYHGITDDIGEARFTLRTPSGDTLTRILTSVPFWPHFMWTGSMPIGNDEPPVFTAPREDAYTYRLMNGQKTLYIQFNQCIDQPGRETAAEFADEVKLLLDNHLIDRCIIDLRNNDGGQGVYERLLNVVRDDPQINRPGRLFVLTGRRTFSAAVMFATQLQLQTNALFFGEPTGQGPIFYSRPRMFELPHSGLLFTVSSHYTVAAMPFDKRRAIEPDSLIPYGIEDFRQGRDPVLQAALSYTSRSSDRRSIPAGDVRSLAGRYLYDHTLLLDISSSDGSLQATLTDGMPGSPVRFFTDLEHVRPSVYATRLRETYLRFDKHVSSITSGVIVDWMGTPVTFDRADDGYTLPFERFERGDIAGGCSDLLGGAGRYKRFYPNLEEVLNSLGYRYLRGERTGDALLIFRLNVDLFPQSSNVYDSYGEALMVDDQIDSSLANYRRSLEMNPENSNAERVIRRLLELKDDGQ